MKKILIILLLILAPFIVNAQSPFGPLPPDDTPYNAATWNGDMRAPTKNAVRDEIETILGNFGPLTANCILLGNGALGITVMPVGLTGQVLVGATGAAPAWTANLTVTTLNGNTITAGTGTLTIGAGLTLTVDESVSMSSKAPKVFYERVKSSTGTLTVAEMKWSQINNYGQANNVTLTMDPGATGLGFAVLLGTTVAKYYRFDPDNTNQIFYDGTTCGAGKYLGIASAVQGAALSCRAFQTGAATYDWYCSGVYGNWVCEP